MKKSMLVAGLVLLTIGLVACKHTNSTSASPHGAAVKNGVFVHITAGPEDPHRVLMGLQMAVLMSETEDVLVYFDINGIEVVLADAGDVQYRQFPSARMQLKALLTREVAILACPGCLKAAGKKPEDLLEGVRLADKESFFGFTPGRILTIDY
jgi:predicted peroxiredoxin